MGKAQLVKGDLPDEIFNDFSGRQELAVDCEMMGLNPHRDRLCVIQIKAEQGVCALVQVDESLPYPNLRAVMKNPDVLKIFHFGRMDLLFLRARLNMEVNGIYCTKIASKLARTYTDKHGLKELVRVICGENLDKTNQTSDWGRENLTADQLFYAENDVKFLFKIRRELEAMLEREKRAHLARAAIEYLPSLVELDMLGYESIFEH